VAGRRCVKRLNEAPEVNNEACVEMGEEFVGFGEACDGIDEVPGAEEAGFRLWA